MFNLNLEEKIIDGIKSRLLVETEIIDNKKELTLVTTSYFDGKEVSTHRQDLLPLFEAFKKRLNK